MMSPAFGAHFIITTNYNESSWIFCAIRGGKMYTSNSTDLSCLPVIVFDAGYPKFTLCEDGCKKLAKPYLQQAVASDSAQSLVFVTK